MNYIYSACPEAHVFYGHAFDDSLEDRIQITVIATGFPAVRASAMGKKNAARNPRFGRTTARESGLDAPVDGSEISAIKNKNMDEELQRPAFLRMRPSRLRS